MRNWRRSWRRTWRKGVGRKYIYIYTYVCEGIENPPPPRRPNGHGFCLCYKVSHGFGWFSNVFHGHGFCGGSLLSLCGWVGCVNEEIKNQNSSREARILIPNFRGHIVALITFNGCPVFSNICAHICAHICILRAYIYIYIWPYVRICSYMCICAHICIYTYIYAYTCARIRIYIYMYICAHICIYVHMFAYVCICSWMGTYVCIDAQCTLRKKNEKLSHA